MEIVSPNLETVTSTLKPQQPVPKSFAPGTTSGTNTRKVPESFSTPKGYGEQHFTKNWIAYDAWRVSKQQQLDSSIQYVRNLKQQIVDVQPALEQARVEGDTATVTLLNEQIALCKSLIPEENKLVAQLTREIAEGDAWFRAHSTWPPVQKDRADNLASEAVRYANHLKVQQMGLEKLDKLIHEQQALLADVELVLQAALAADPSTANIVSADDISVSKRQAADIRRVLELLLNERKLLVQGMEAALAEHHDAMARIDAAPVADVFSVTTEATVQELLTQLIATVVTQGQHTHDAIKNTLYPPNTAVFVTWYSPDVYTLNTAWITSYDPLKLYSGIDVPEGAFVAVVLPDQSCFNQTHGFFESVGAFVAYVDQFYTNELEIGKVEAREYCANPDAEPTQPASSRAPLVQDVAHQVLRFDADHHEGSTND